MISLLGLTRAAAQKDSLPLPDGTLFVLRDLFVCGFALADFGLIGDGTGNAGLFEHASDN